MHVSTKSSFVLIVWIRVYVVHVRPEESAESSNTRIHVNHERVLDLLWTEQSLRHAEGNHSTNLMLTATVFASDSRKTHSKTPISRETFDLQRIKDSGPFWRI